jgi:phospholipase C
MYEGWQIKMKRKFLKSMVVATIALAINISSIVLVSASSDTDVKYIPEQKSKLTKRDIELIKPHIEIINKDSSGTGQINPEWGTGYLNTHVFLVSQGILNLPSQYRGWLYESFSGTNGATVLMANAGLPDTAENDTLYGIPSWKGHFYGPYSGKTGSNYNYYGETEPTAYTRFNNHYYNAKVSFNSDKNYAYKELSMALHYLGDLSNPHHATNLTALNSWHTDFEGWVDQRTNNYAVSNNCIDVTGKTFKQIADECRSFAASYISYANATKYEARAPKWDSTNAGYAAQNTLTRAQGVSAGLIYRFLKDVGKI